MRKFVMHVSLDILLLFLIMDMVVSSIMCRSLYSLTISPFLLLSYRLLIGYRRGPSQQTQIPA